jgi:hypothetical protein
MLSARMEEMEAELQRERAAEVRLQVCGSGCVDVWVCADAKRTKQKKQKKMLPFRPLFKGPYCRSCSIKALFKALFRLH